MEQPRIYILAKFNTLTENSNHRKKNYQHAIVTTYLGYVSTIHKLLTVDLQVSYILYLQLWNNVSLQRFHTLYMFVSVYQDILHGSAFFLIRQNEVKNSKIAIFSYLPVEITKINSNQVLISSSFPGILRTKLMTS